MTTTKPTYLCGIQPTGRLHVGHWLGVLSEAKRLQDDGSVVSVFVAHLHSGQSGKVHGAHMDMKCDLHRLGFDRVESQKVCADVFTDLLHAAPLGVLRSMTQFKTKGGNDSSAMLLVYPVLMAADILNYGTDYVIVGEDQLQHVEFANDLYRRAGLSYRVKPHLSPTPRVMSLADPSRKMSKSLGDKHCLYLLDEDYGKKLAGAVTDDQGRENLRRIWTWLGCAGDFIPSEMKQMKEEIAWKMNEIFGRK